MELVREVAEIVSETLVDKYRLEVEVEEALGLSEVVRRKGEEGDLKGRGGVRRGLSLHDVLSKFCAFFKPCPHGSLLLASPTPQHSPF